MRLYQKTALSILCLILTALALTTTSQLAAADGAGGFPTATPTRAIATVIVITPQAAQDLAPKSVEIQGDAPLPEPGEAARSETLLQAAPVPGEDSPTTQTGGNNLRLLLTAGGIVMVVLLIGVVVFRLRS